MLKRQLSPNKDSFWRRPSDLYTVGFAAHLVCSTNLIQMPTEGRFDIYIFKKTAYFDNIKCGFSRKMNNFFFIYS